VKFAAYRNKIGMVGEGEIGWKESEDGTPVQDYGVSDVGT
jgi:hypothetical protein